MKASLYLDASVLLRILFREKGDSPDLKSLNDFYSSEIVEVEIFRTLERARYTERIDDKEVATKSQESMRLIHSLNRIPVHSEIIQNARGSFPFSVRALDALHVGSAEWLQNELGHHVQFWTHDNRQSQAAMCRRLNVFGL